MDKQQATQFVDNLLDHIVSKADVESLAQFYQPDVVGHYGDIEFNFSDIENRVHYLNSVFKHRRHVLHEVIIADDKIIFRNRQFATHRKSNVRWSYEVVGVYTIRAGRVVELWLMTDKEMDYQETVDHGLEHALQQDDDDSAKQLFREFIAAEQYRVNDELQSIELTEREFETLFYTMRGFTAKQIGQHLTLSFRTVESYLETLKEKFDCHSKAELRRKVAPGAIWM